MARAKTQTRGQALPRGARLVIVMSTGLRGGGRPLWRAANAQLFPHNRFNSLSDIYVPQKLDNKTPTPTSLLLNASMCDIHLAQDMKSTPPPPPTPAPFCCPNAGDSDLPLSGQ